VKAFYGDAPNIPISQTVPMAPPSLEEAQRYPEDYDGILAGAQQIIGRISSPALCGTLKHHVKAASTFHPPNPGHRPGRPGRMRRERPLSKTAS